MKDHKEKISALLDGELSSDEYSTLHVSNEANQIPVSSRYQMIGDSLRSSITDLSFIDVSSNVNKAVAEEQQYKGSVISFNFKNKISSLFNVSSWLQPAAGLAIAASVAVLVIVGVDKFDEINTTSNLAIVEDIPINSNIDVAVQPEIFSDKSAAELEKYIEEHSRFASQDTLQGIFPYARAVSYESK